MKSGVYSFHMCLFLVYQTYIGIYILLLLYATYLQQWGLQYC